MAISVFDLFTVGIGPSSSHTVGPVKTARTFVTKLADDCSSAWKARRIRETGRLRLLGRHEVDFREPGHLTLHRRRTLPFHPNGMQFRALDPEGRELAEPTYYSVGGGFVVDGTATGVDRTEPGTTPVRHPFSSASERLTRARESGLPISGVMLANELSWRGESEVRAGLLRIRDAMRACVDRGCSRTGTTLPGRLKVRSRAPQLHRDLAEDVNEENASGGRVATAPTNGAAGIVPAALHYCTRFAPGADEDGAIRFLLTAGAVGALFKAKWSTT